MSHELIFRADENFPLIHTFDQTDWQLDGWKNHIKVHATLAIITSNHFCWLAVLIYHHHHHHKHFVFIFPTHCFSSSTTARSPIESIDFELFQDDLENIDQELLQSVVSIFSFFTFEEIYFEKQFLLMTKEATYAYSEEICSWLSLKHTIHIYPNLLIWPIVMVMKG
ncbi:hypothetical protein DERF_012468, partial [Dermatophagoides farinae]